MITSSTKNQTAFSISTSLLAVFALHTEHHALATHLTHLRQPGLGRKPTKDNKRKKKLVYLDTVV